MKQRSRFYTLILSGILILIFILQYFIPGFTELFFLSEQAMIRPWQFITAVFLHGGLLHLMYNLLALLLFGLILEQLIGSKKFLVFFFLSGILANVVSWFWYPNALGASGAIMGILGVLAILKPMMSVWAFGMIIPMFIAAILWAAGSVMGIFGFGDQGVGHLAHLLGLVVGLFYGIYLKAGSKRKIKPIEIKIPESYTRSWENKYMDK
jgi:membrane associated rhomboid family serine protease